MFKAVSLRLRRKPRPTYTLRFCTGGDIEQRELYLSFNSETFLWKIVQPIKAEKEKVDEIISLLSDFIKSTSVFTGTATELAEKLKLFGGADCLPAVLKKKIIRYMAYLQKNNISYSENRTFERRKFTLRYDGNDGMTEESAPLELPSLLSQPSAEDR